mmetsp:Transcript_28438/g.65516  ORF Transcript_28438/g.65516 Transcript_28438/m.65516 type:complete len:278 (-) Transcript_28438:1497-2330(-)
MRASVPIADTRWARVTPSRTYAGSWALLPPLLRRAREPAVVREAEAEWKKAEGGEAPREVGVVRSRSGDSVRLPWNSVRVPSTSPSPPSLDWRPERDSGRSGEVALGVLARVGVPARGGGESGGRGVLGERQLGTLGSLRRTSGIDTRLRGFSGGDVLRLDRVGELPPDFGDVSEVREFRDFGELGETKARVRTDFALREGARWGGDLDPAKELPRGGGHRSGPLPVGDGDRWGEREGEAGGEVAPRALRGDALRGGPNDAPGGRRACALGPCKSHA